MTDSDDVVDATADLGPGTHCTTYDVEREAPSLVLVEAIAAAKGTDPFALDPLGNSLDLDALDSILQSTRGDSAVEVTVESLGVRATIDSVGTVVVRQNDDRAPDDDADE